MHFYFNLIVKSINFRNQMIQVLLLIFIYQNLEAPCIMLETLERCELVYPGQSHDINPIIRIVFGCRRVWFH